jgi:hypothetical protein
MVGNEALYIIVPKKHTRSLGTRNKHYNKCGSLPLVFFHIELPLHKMGGITHFLDNVTRFSSI